ncbi:MAG: response regulator [Bacteroidota bacterium]
MIEIALVDSNDTEGKLLNFVLKDLKLVKMFQVIHFKTGNSALEYLHRREREHGLIIITEFMLAGMSGLDLIGRLREQMEWKNIPVVVHALNQWPVKIEAAYNAGACIVLNKESELDETIEQFRGFLLHMHRHMTRAESRI